MCLCSCDVPAGIPSLRVQWWMQVCVQQCPPGIRIVIVRISVLTSHCDWLLHLVTCATEDDWAIQCTRKGFCHSHDTAPLTALPLPRQRDILGQLLLACSCHARQYLSIVGELE